MFLSFNSKTTGFTSGTGTNHSGAHLSSPLGFTGTANNSGAHLSSPLGFTGVHVARSLVFCVVFCGLLFVLLSFLFWPLCCLSFGHCVVCLLIIVLSVFWSLCCLSFGHCVVCLLVIVLSVLVIVLSVF